MEVSPKGKNEGQIVDFLSLFAGIWRKLVGEMYMSTTKDGYPGNVAYMPAGKNPGGMMGSNYSNGNDDDDKYITTTKIMVVALAVLFAVVFFVICFHLYCKWVWSTSTPTRAPAGLWPRRWRHRSSSSNRVSEVVVLDANVFDINVVAGLDKAEVEAIPTFRYKKGGCFDENTGALECAICLGQFQDDELGRTLPKCGHPFHQQCIDMWLHSHSTCPLCRAFLEPGVHDCQSHIPVFRAERMRTRTRTGTPRRLLPSDHTLPLPHPDEPAAAAGEESEQQPEQQPEQHPEQETGYKSADSIPANILFWGDLLQQAGAASTRVVNLAPQQLQVPSQVAIDIDMASTTAPNQLAPDISPAAAAASASL